MSDTDENFEDIPTDVTTEDDRTSKSGETSEEENVEEDDEQKKNDRAEDVEEEEEEDEKKAEEEAVEEEEEPEYYDTNLYISKASISNNGTLPLNILEFHFSYGYDCRKNFNLVVLDGNTLCFASGNFINFFSVPNKKIWFRRSALGGGIGHIRKNPNPEYPHFAVAECGKRPIIIVYVWPSLDIICILRGGATRTYTNLDYSPDGELLVSQSGEPDYMITVWDWKKHKILLRNKSYINDVFRVKFSPYVPGHITTGGVAHIKFWKMVETFTGLKLIGEVGRFGRTEYSDILGVLPMPDEKVVSGCTWGNILIWDGGLITLEVFRSSRKRCHDRQIVQLAYNDGELWTVSQDGHVRVWWYEKIDQADPPDDDRVILLDPSYDFYTPGLSLYCTEKRYPDNSEDSWFVGQDGNGGLWLLDFNTDGDPKPSVLLYRCHAGQVKDIASCPFSNYLASLGEGGRLFLYNYLTKKLVFQYSFPASGRCLEWLPIKFSGTGDLLIAGFDDGQIRVFRIDLRKEDSIKLTVQQVIKPHNKPLTKMSINQNGSILVSAGEDSRIFVMQMRQSQYADELLDPIGYVDTPDLVTTITWHPDSATDVLVGCLKGQMMQVSIPEEPQDYTDVSFELKVDPIYKRFSSYKSQIRRDIRIRQIEAKKAKKVAKKRKEMERIKKENPGLEIDEEVFLADSDTEEELEPLFFPEVPNKILWLKYTEDSTIWLSVGGYDAGYIYEYTMDQKDDIPLKFRMVADADDIEISSYVYSYKKEYLIFAMEDGSIRVNKVNKKDFRDLSDYWRLSMHDNQNGFVPKLCFSYDERFFFSCGHDGNVFSYTFKPNNYIYPEKEIPEERVNFPAMYEEDVTTNYSKLSLEETKIKAENDRINKVANEHKAQYREQLRDLKERYAEVLLQNSMLPKTQIIPKEELELDERVTEYVDNEFQAKLDLVKRKLAYDVQKSETQMKKLKAYITDPVDKFPIVVKGINNPELKLLNVRQRFMNPMFNTVLKIVEEKLIEEQLKEMEMDRLLKISLKRPIERAVAPPKQYIPKPVKGGALEYFLLSLSPSVIERSLGSKLNRMLQKYRERKAKWERRAEEWDMFNARKPVPGKNHPDDERQLAEAKETIGDYKIKDSDDYRAPPAQRDTTVKKYKQVFDARLKQFNLRHAYITKVWSIRDQKYVTRDKLFEKKKQLQAVQQELPHQLWKMSPPIPDIQEDEFPEEKLKVKVVMEYETEPVEKKAEVQFVQPPDADQLERDIIPYRQRYPSMDKGKFVSTYPDEAVQKIPEQNLQSLIDAPEDVDTPYEMCIRVRRLNRNLFRQFQIISEMDQLINDFNNTIEEAKVERLPLLASGNFIDLHILTLNQELNILKQFEHHEDALTDKVNESLKKVHAKEDELDILKNKQERIEAEIENLHLEESKIQEKFKHAAENNKFYDFLKKVFKKKFKPPKVHVEGESSSESSSSSSSEESDDDDTGSIDSKDFGFIKQDLNVCPKGCELAIYNLTVELRSKRHEVEQAVRDQKSELELVKKNIDMANRVTNSLQNHFKATQRDLENYQREKQKLLNEVKCVTILKANQICDLNVDHFSIDELLVFSKTRLSELYKRVGELQYEDYQQKSTYDVYMKHLCRMKKDLNYMRSKKKVLQNDYQRIMKEQFGRIVDINELQRAILAKNFQKTHVNELEEVVLKKLVYEVRVKTNNMRELFNAELRHWNSRIHNTQEALAVIIKENTKRLELLQVISHEKKELVNVISAQPRKKEHLEKIEGIQEKYNRTLEKLERFVEDQQKQIQDLKLEIKMLKTKGMPHRERRKEELGDIIKEQVEMETSERELSIEERDIIETKESEEVTVILDIKEDTGIYIAEAEYVVRDMLSNLLADVDTRLSQLSVENMVKSILSGILQTTSVVDIVNEIVNNLPITPSDEQLKIIDESAEKLRQIQEISTSEESLLDCAHELLEDVLDEVMMIAGTPHDVIFKMVNKLVDLIPSEILLRERSLNTISDKIKDIVRGGKLDSEELRNYIERMPQQYRQLVGQIINAILERVYGEGIDYIYIIKHE